MQKRRGWQGGTSPGLSVMKYQEVVKLLEGNKKGQVALP
jgi:hypothetical protein